MGLVLMGSTSQNLLHHPSPLQRLALSNLHLLIIFAYMQALDLLSTLAFLLGGVQEANPIVRFAMNAAGRPIIGLVLVKAFAILLGFYCWWSGRVSLLKKVNILFAVLIVHNLCCLILGLAAR